MTFRRIALSVAAVAVVLLTPAASSPMGERAIAEASTPEAPAALTVTSAAVETGIVNPPPGPSDEKAARGHSISTGSPNSDDPSPRAYITYKTPYEFFLSALTIILAMAMAIALCVMAWHTGITDNFLRSFMVIVVIFAALFLVVAGYSDKQTAPVFGLLGTMAGYIFGRSQQQAEDASGAKPEATSMPTSVGSMPAAPAPPNLAAAGDKSEDAEAPAPTT